MAASRKTRQAAKPRKKSAAFTLIELLAVIAIMAVLVSLVVGVAYLAQGMAAKSMTTTTIAMLSAAISAYYDSYGDYPPDREGSAWPNPEPLTSDPNATYAAGDGIQVLYMYLTGQHYTSNTFQSLDKDLSAQPCVQAARNKIANLPKDAWSVTDHCFRDGFGNSMRYHILGGKPVLISAGPDGMFTVNPLKSNADASIDNIRSDNR